MDLKKYGCSTGKYLGRVFNNSPWDFRPWLDEQRNRGRFLTLPTYRGRKLGLPSPASYPVKWVRLRNLPRFLCSSSQALSLHWHKTAKSYVLFTLFAYFRTTWRRCWTALNSSSARASPRRSCAPCSAPTPRSRWPSPWSSSKVINKKVTSLSSNTSLVDLYALLLLQPMWTMTARCLSKVEEVTIAITRGRRAPPAALAALFKTQFY